MKFVQITEFLRTYYMYPKVLATVQLSPQRARTNSVTSNLSTPTGSVRDTLLSSSCKSTSNEKKNFLIKSYSCGNIEI